MPTAYFDTNFYDHLHKRIDVSEKQLAELRAAASRRLRILVGDVNVEELVQTVETNPAVAREQVALLMDLTDVTKNFLRPHEHMVVGDLRAYASNEEPPPRLAKPAQRRSLAANLRAFVEKGEMTDDLKAGIEETRAQKERYKADMDKGQAEVAPARNALGDQVPTFEEYRTGISPGLAMSLAQGAGVGEPCKRRGVSGLLDVRTIGMSCDLNASLIYARTFEDRGSKGSDSRDVIHAVLATSSDIFVVNDRKFRRLLDRVVPNGLQIMSLTEFAKAVPNL